MQNDGQGKFTDVTRSAGITAQGHGLSATWFDYDGDGDADLHVANDLTDPDYFFRNNGDGTFTDIIQQIAPYTTWYSMGADAADLNNDGLLDLFVADMSGTTHFKRKTSMGAMSDSQTFLATANPPQYMRNVVYLNSGAERFLEAAYLAGLANSDWTWGVKAQDFDNDGRVDLLITNGVSKNFNDSDNPGATELRLGETEWQRHVRAGTPPLKEQNLAFRNQSDLRFQDVSRNWGLDHVGMSYASAAADFDRDGDLDLVVVNLDEEVSLYRNNSQDGRRVLVELKGTRSNAQGIGATVKVRSASGQQIRQITPTRGYMAMDEAIAHFGLGDDERIERLTIEWPSGHVQTFDDLPVDQHYTITEPDEDPPRRRPPSPRRRCFAQRCLGEAETPRDAV